MISCPACHSEEVRAADCYEFVFEVGPDGRPADLINAEDVLDGPIDDQFYYLCMECDHRWDLHGAALQVPSSVPTRIEPDAV